VKELAEPAQKETVGVYDTATLKQLTKQPHISKSTYVEVVENSESSIEKEEVDRPRRKR